MHVDLAGNYQIRSLIKSIKMNENGEFPSLESIHCKRTLNMVIVFEL